MSTKRAIWWFGVSILCVGLLGCPEDDDTDSDGGSAGQSGSSGTGASSGTGGAGGTGGTGGTGGNAGDAGTMDCDCLRGAYLPVCGVDGVSYDATCGRACVPVEIACDGECPCPGAACGSVTCGVDERCCNHCDSSCVAMNARIACPDDADPDPACGSCAQEGESCTSSACCWALTCCAGVPIPVGEEHCSTNCPISDYRQKTDFSPVNPQAVLDGVLALPITRWRYTSDATASPHIGPMAQDFQATFGVGATDTMIFPLDEGGVSLLAIQALHAQLDALRKEQQALREEQSAARAAQEALRLENQALREQLAASAK